MRFISSPKGLGALVAAASVASACANGVTDSSDSPETSGDADASTVVQEDAGGTGTANDDAGSESADSAPRADSSSRDLDGAAGESGVDSSALDAAFDATLDSPLCQGFSGALVTFDLSAQSGSEPSVPAASAATGVSSGPLTRASSINAVSGSGSINGSNWALTATADASRYYSFTVTPPSGCTIALTSLSLDVHASSSGPLTGDVATSADGYAAHSASFSGTRSGNVSLGASSASAIEVRVYGYAATSAAGTFRIQNALQLSGTLR